MSRRFRLPGLVLMTLLCFLPAIGSAKHKHNAGVSECQQRVADRIRKDHPPSRGSSFASDVERTKLGDNAVTISGRGFVRTAKGKNRRFTYSCVYNHRSGKLSKVKYNIP
jgi:hypothetical protein